MRSGLLVRDFLLPGGGLKCLAFPCCGRRMFSGSADGATMWDAATGEELWSRDFGSLVTSFAELSDGRVAIGCEDAVVQVVDGSSGGEISVCRRHTSSINTIASLAEGAFASGSYECTIFVWGSDGSLARTVAEQFSIYALAPSPCGRRMAVGLRYGAVSLRRIPEWDLVWSAAKVHDEGVCSADWSPDARFLVTGSFDGSAKILSPESGAVLLALWGPGVVYVFAVLFSHDGTKVFVASDDNYVRAWRVFWPMERRLRGLMGGVEVSEGDWGMKEVCCEIVARMKRLWEVGK
jgi:WD40 repeat protein